MSTHDPSSTITQTKADAIRVPSLRVRVVQPNAPEVAVPLGLRPLHVGTAAECDIVLQDSKVSRFHLEIYLQQRGVFLSDPKSKNGTFVGPAQIVMGYVSLNMWVMLGDCRLVVETAGPPNDMPISISERFGGAMGKSLLMRSLFQRLEHVAKFDSPVLLRGEQGTGKRTLAEAVHRTSSWASGPWRVLDVEAIPRDALEIEMFGCAPGVRPEVPEGRAGALEESHGGTLYIAEPTDIPFPLQQKLAAALNARVCYRLGGAAGVPFRSRLIAGTQRSLDALAASGALDTDLFRWLSVFSVDVPALRERKEDIALLVEHFLAARTPQLVIADLPADTIELFEGHAWPHNVGQLKSLVERLAVYPQVSRDALASMLAATPKASEDVSIRPLLTLTLEEARNVVEERFMKLYLTAQLELHGANVSQAAKAMDVHRVHLHKLLRRYGLRRGED